MGNTTGILRVLARLLTPAALLPAALASPAGMPDAAVPVGEPVLEPATLHCLGAYWTLRGDANRNARVRTEYRPAGSAGWAPGPLLFRVEPGAHQPRGRGSRVEVPAGASLFAGSVVDLTPGTSYELRLRLEDPDGGAAERILTARTAAEPALPAGMRVLHVVPGEGGGAGTEADPFRGLAAAREAASPGTLFLLHAGRYRGSFAPGRSGEEGRPIVWRAAGDGEAVLEGGGAARVLDASGLRDVWFEALTVRGASYGLIAHEAARVVVRRCRFEAVKNGIVASRNERDQVRGFVLTDNVLEGLLA